LNSTNVILYSYRRPEQTARAIERILKWQKLGTLFVSIDGLRLNAPEEERQWRHETISVAECFAGLDSRVNPIAWVENNGLTSHQMRILPIAFARDNKVISLEEDNFIETEGLEFLARAVSSNSPAIATAFSSQGHFNVQRDIRLTYFPEQWATSLTTELFESFSTVWNDKVVSREIVKKEFQKLYPFNRIKLELVVERWFRIYNVAANTFSYGDALMSYAALRLELPYIAPMNTLVRDIGYEDPRGLHPRTGELRAVRHKFSPSVKGFPDVCMKCENATNQLPGMGLKVASKHLLKRVKAPFLGR
jgi:hypothetical protein